MRREARVSTEMSPSRSPFCAGRTSTRWCQACWPEMGSGGTGKMRFWGTPGSRPQMRARAERGQPQGGHERERVGRGKTTIGRLMGKAFDAQFISLSAVFSGRGEELQL